MAVISFAVGDAAGSSGKTPSPSSPSPVAAAQSAGVSSSPAPQQKTSARPRVLARFKGSGIQNTSRFTVAGSGNWELKWSYNCAAFGDSGNFIVTEDDGSDFSGASVNELGPGGHGVTHVYSDAGTHYLAVNSECDWSLKAVALP